MDLEAVIREVVEGAGLDLWEVELQRRHGRRVLRVTVDRAGGVDLDSIAETSERIGRRLDQEGFGPGPYDLEVSSPGLERALRGQRDFERSVGRLVKVRTVEPVGGSRTLSGTLVRVGPGGIRIDTDSGPREVAYDLIASARTVFEWRPEGTRGAGGPGRPEARAGR